MTVAAAINGQIAAEGAAFFALKYAGALGRVLELVHISNSQDSREEVEASMGNIEEAAADDGVEVRRLMLEGDRNEAISSYLAERKPDILFCGTRVQKKVRRDSFSQRLVSMRPDCELAVVRTLHVGAALELDKSLLPIREDRMSPEKFAFFAGLLKGYEAAGEIYSITPLRARRRSELDPGQVRESLEQIDRQLSHYSRLAGLAGLPLHVKHAFASDENAQILHHIHHYGYQLLVLGGRRPFLPFLKPDRTDRLLELTPVNTIFFYSRGRRSCSFSS